MKIQSELVNDAPERHTLSLASTLLNLAIISNAEGEVSESENYFTEAHNLRKKFLEKAPPLVSDLLKLDFENVVQNEIWAEETEPIIFVI
ncbi:MAG: hypothetical protein ACFFD6_04025 [Candidatus Thorarchaeota archaeon]